MANMTKDKRIAVIIILVTVLFAVCGLLDIWLFWKHRCHGHCPGTSCYEKCVKAGYCPVYGDD